VALCDIKTGLLFFLRNEHSSGKNHKYLVPVYLLIRCTCISKYELYVSYRLQHAFI